MTTVLETARLLLRPFVLEDAGDFLELNRHPEVMRYVPDTPLSSVSEARAILESAPLRDYALYGYGRLACVPKGESRVIGFCGLKFLPELDEVDIGYRFLPEYWGRGLATESARCVMDHGRDVLGLKGIIGIVDAGNLASAQVLKNLGMSYEGTIPYAGLPQHMDIYRDTSISTR